MKKMISLFLVLVICLSFCCTAYADEFVDSPNQNPTTSQCDHSTTKVVNQKDATCTSEGYSGDIVCSKCGEVIEEGEVIAKAAHQYDENGVCVVCGAKKGSPDTGDNNPLGLWIGLMAFAAVALVAVVVCNKKFAKR